MLIGILAAAAVASGGSGAPAQDPEVGARGAPRGDYRASCSGEYVNRGRLYADCRDNRGRIRETSIELNRCTAYEIRNNDGRLVCGPFRGDYEDRPGAGGGGGGWGDPGGGWNGRGIVVYRDDGYRGTSLTFNSAISDLGQSGMNDEISSMRMRGPWTACSDAHFQGQCQTFTGDVSSLRAVGMNDRISSLRPGRFDGGGGGGGGGWGNASITVFVDALYRGGSRTFSGEIANLANSGMNDRISSMRLRGDWEVCTDAYFRGRCEIIREDLWNLEQRGLNDRISSMRPVRRGGR